LKSFAQTKPNSLTAFRLPNGVLATVDLICDQQDLTRSQIFRRSVMEFLKSQQVDIVELTPTEPKLTWSEDLYKRVGQTP
jgi:hypothetical protein